MKKSGWRLLQWFGVICLFGLVVWISARPVSPVVPQRPLRVRVEPLPEEAYPLGEEKSRVASVIAPVPLLPPLPGAVLSPAPPSLPPRTGAPKIAIVIDDMGLNIAGSERAVRLPDYVTLSYIPYAHNLPAQAGAARAAGHELLLHMPMEPLGRDNPGPGALLTGLSADELRARFVKALDSFRGFDGVNNHMGSKFTADQPGMEIVVDELQKRNLFFLDSRTSARSVGAAVAHARGVPAVRRDVFLDDDMTPAAVERQLIQLERIARHRGTAIAIGHPHQVTLEALEKWLPEAQKRGIEFVPLRELAGRR